MYSVVFSTFASHQASFAPSTGGQVPSTCSLTLGRGHIWIGKQSLSRTWKGESIKKLKSDGIGVEKKFILISYRYNDNLHCFPATNSFYAYLVLSIHSQAKTSARTLT